MVYVPHYIEPPNREEINRRHNQLVGIPTRNPRPTGEAGRRVRRAREEAQRQPPASKSVVTYLTKHGGASASARKRYEQWYGSGPTSYYGPGEGTVKSYKSAADKLINDYNKQVLDQNAMRTEYAANVLNQQVNPQNPRVVPPSELPTAPASQKTPPVKTNELGLPVDEHGRTSLKHQARLNPAISHSFLGSWSQEIADRLANAGMVVPSAIHEGLQNVFSDTGESPTQKLSDFFSGMGKGAIEDLRGNKAYRYGSGQDYELYKNQSPDPLAGQLRSLERHAPWVEQNIARAVGLAGDFYLDPLGHVGFEKGGVIGGEHATSESMRNFLSQTAKEEAAHYENMVTGLAKGTGGYRPQASEQAVERNLEAHYHDVLDTTELEISGGGSRGRYQVADRNLTSSIIGQKTGKVVEEGLTKHFSDDVQKLVDGIEGTGQRLDGAALDTYAKAHPDFEEFIDNVEGELVSKGRIPPNPTRDMVANALEKSDVKNLIREEQARLINEKYGPYVKEATDRATSYVKRSYYNAPGIRVGHRVYPVKPIGRAYATIEDRFLSNKVARNLRYDAAFPAKLGIDTTRARAWTVPGTEQFEKDLKEAAAPFSKDEMEALQQAKDKNLPLSSRLQAVDQWITNIEDTMWEREYAAGARGRERFRGPSTPKDPDYAYVANRGGSVADRTEFKNKRKAEIRDNVRKGIRPAAGRYKTENAIEQGLKPRKNAFEALHQRMIKHNRDMIRAQFRTDLVENYGIRARLTAEEKGYSAFARGLSKVEFSKLPEYMRQQLEHSGEEMFLPREIYDMMSKFEEVTKWNGTAQESVVRNMTKVTNLIKRMQTLPWPRFHIKNMIGDVFMSLLDGVGFSDFADVVRKYSLKKAGRKAEWELVPGLTKTVDEMWNLYEHEANSGFNTAELGGLGSVSPTNLPHKVIAKVAKKAQDWSGIREDIGRFTHYVTAYKDEAKRLWKKGERDISVIERKAGDAALWRVNHYKIDYNALMLWEKKAKTLYFPFYTFYRKAAPVMLQALYQDPRWLIQWHNFLYQNSAHEGSASQFDGFRVPADIRDYGYAFLPGQSDENEPWYVKNDILPTSVFSQVRTNSPHNFANSVLSQLNPAFQIGIEQATNKQLFQDRPLNRNQSFLDFLAGKVPGTRESNMLLGNKPLGEKLLNLAVGSSISKLRENQQLFAEQEWKDRMIDQPLHDINYSQDLFYIAPGVDSDGKARTYVVKDKMNLQPNGDPTPVATFYTASEAIDYVKKALPKGYKKQNKTYDIDNQGNPIYRPVGAG